MLMWVAGEQIDTFASFAVPRAISLEFVSYTLQSKLFHSQGIYLLTGVGST
jgi:hypothetical protein